MLIGARRIERLEALARELGDNVGWTRLDVTEREGFAAFAAAAEERFGRIDVLVNNAGVMPLSPFAALLVEQWNWMIDVSIRGVLNGIAAVLPHFQARGSGQIVNIASIAAHRVVPAVEIDLHWLVFLTIRSSSRQVISTAGDCYLPGIDGGRTGALRQHHGDSNDQSAQYL
ncbi:SDR family oxidoreductase [Mesorhizobium captivum]|uniref:SDR family oxidoreductase n=1 Tax=Mesorhizobium captivum TaxID=3072319 RepID=UPI003D31398C